MKIKEWQEEIHHWSIEKGWCEHDRPIPELLCLIHSEVSEALEAYRVNDMENFAIELADIAIRLFDTSEALNIDLEKEIEKKHQVNKQRPYRHGNKVC